LSEWDNQGPAAKRPGFPCNQDRPISALRTTVETTKGVAALLVISISTVVLTTVLCFFAIFKFIAPTPALRNRIRRFLAGLAETWISINNGVFALYRSTAWDIEVPDTLNYRGSYMVSSNHQSWVDILVLQRTFNRRIPFMRFFLKSQLFWVPFLGIAWWTLDMPFMRRDSQEKLKKNPALRGRDLENARKACEKFRGVPVSIMNFPEGTRFSARKRDRGKASYRNLLAPRIGGIGQAFYALSEDLDALLDVTICYPQTADGALAPTFWDLLCGRIPRIVVRVERRDIPPALLGRNFRQDRTFRKDLEAWVNGIWADKDRLLDELKMGSE
jgi:1-acyl-sn-glycerol-3-phosphate acyltransferase